jgi:hypothetical protein
VYGGFLYIKHQQPVQPQTADLPTAETQEKVMIENEGQVAAEVSLQEKVLQIVNDETGQMSLYDISVSPDQKYAYATLMHPRGGLFYHLFDLENKKDLFDGYTVAGSGELNTTNHVWTNDDRLILVSDINGHGGEGFPGILVVNLADQTMYRLVDMTNKCPHASISDCRHGYRFWIESFQNNTLDYLVVFDSESIGYDSSYSYEASESITVR